MLSLLSSLWKKRPAAANAPVAPAAAAAAAPAPQPCVDFTCNLCGTHHAQAPLKQVCGREDQSCPHCRSSLRMRSLVHTLSMELFGRSIPLVDFPHDHSVRGLGMSDWEGYAHMLARKLAYTNTLYHQEPRLDITDAPAHWLGQQRFVISSDVFEHIPPAVLPQAFRNSRLLLQDGGFSCSPCRSPPAALRKNTFRACTTFASSKKPGGACSTTPRRRASTSALTTLSFTAATA